MFGDQTYFCEDNMKRIFLFLLTNLAVMLVLGVVLERAGFEPS